MPPPRIDEGGCARSVHGPGGGRGAGGLGADAVAGLQTPVMIKCGSDHLCQYNCVSTNLGSMTLSDSSPISTSARRVSGG
jgi:hypothetical protein